MVRQRTLDPPYVGSNPTAPAIAIDARGPNRQVIELEGSRLARASPSGGEAFQRLPSARRKRGILLLVTGRGWLVGGARLPAQARGDGDEAESGTGFLRAKGLDYDGGYSVGQMTASPQAILATFERHVEPQ